MKRCQSCDKLYESSIMDCPVCGVSAAIVDGFNAYAPEFAYNGGGFKASYFYDLAQLEDSNFWFRSRNQLIIWALKEYCPIFKTFLEIGCGTGFVLSGLAERFPDVKFYGSEIFLEGLRFAAERLPQVIFMQMDARKIPYYDEFDVVAAFDVLEHIEEDERVLSQMHASLRPQGFMLLTVPQHATVPNGSTISAVRSVFT
jgi:SAM-dependent methyltransferase